LQDIRDKLDQLLARIGQPERAFFTIEHASAFADLSVGSIRRMLAAGQLQAHRPVKGRTLIHRAELESVILSATSRPRNGRGRFSSSERDRRLQLAHHQHHVKTRQ
jgi:hypothetical protein